MFLFVVFLSLTFYSVTSLLPHFPRRPISRMYCNMLLVICSEGTVRGYRYTRWINPSVTNYCVFAFNYYHLLPEERQQRFSDLEETVGSREAVCVCVCFLLVTLLRAAKIFVVGEKKIIQIGRQAGRQMMDDILFALTFNLIGLNKYLALLCNDQSRDCRTLTPQSLSKSFTEQYFKNESKVCDEN